jgi:hypothetical protein
MAALDADICGLGLGPSMRAACGGRRCRGIINDDAHADEKIRMMSKNNIADELSSLMSIASLQLECGGRDASHRRVGGARRYSAHVESNDGMTLRLQSDTCLDKAAAE